MPAQAQAEWEEDLARQVEQDTQIPVTEKRQVILARRGQGKFRERVSMIERACRITQVNRHEHLIASHRKPWRDCESNDERLDGENGLLLTPTVDYLFERRSADLSGGALGVAEADGDSAGREAECRGVFGGAAAIFGVSPGSGVSGGEGAAVAGRAACHAGPGDNLGACGTFRINGLCLRV